MPEDAGSIRVRGRPITLVDAEGKVFKPSMPSHYINPVWLRFDVYSAAASLLWEFSVDERLQFAWLHRSPHSEDMQVHREQPAVWRTLRYRRDWCGKEKLSDASTRHQMKW